MKISTLLSISLIENDKSEVRRPDYSKDCSLLNIQLRMYRDVYGFKYIYPSNYTGDGVCPGRHLHTIYDINSNETSFDLYDATNNKITKDELIDYKGDIQLDIHDGNGEKVTMDHVTLSSGTTTNCGLRWQIPINESGSHACNFYFGINETD